MVSHLFCLKLRHCIFVLSYSTHMTFVSVKEGKQPLTEYERPSKEDHKHHFFRIARFYGLC